ncbi:MAG: hypothetical protein AAFX99_22895, partial [Myxococcota bacterium]
MRAFVFVVFVVFTSCADSSPSDTAGSGSNGTSNGSARMDVGVSNGLDGGRNTSGQTMPECAGPICEGVCCSESEVCAPEGCVPRDALCGFGVCDEGEECVNSTCLPVCSGMRCGASNELCCGGEEVCVFAQCIVPGEPCAESADCAIDEVCETIYGRCVPADADPSACTFAPPVGQFEPVQKWQWLGETSAFPEFNQVMMMPAVANLTDDNGDGLITAEGDIPDVIFTSFSGNRYNHAGILRILSGDDGRVLRELDVGARAGNCPAVADLDADGVPEIVVERILAEDNQTLMAVTPDGTILWENAGISTASGGVAVANLDGQGAPEIIARDRVVSAGGETLCTFASLGALVPISADLDLDGTQEIITGLGVYGFVQTGEACPLLWEAPRLGNPAVGNFDDDPEAEIVVAGQGFVTVLGHDGAVLWDQQIPISEERALEELSALCAYPTCDRDDPNYHKGCCAGGGPPTVADVDNDGEPEITIAARWFYLVYETDGTVRWAHATRDFSSASTGSSVFDFEGDGRAEVVYNDELFLRIYDGEGGELDEDGDGFKDARILFELPNPSGTLLEYPLIVDVDNDGNAEIVVPANNYAFEGTTGLRVFGDANDNWVRTRRIWNQHAYHVTHVTEDGQVVEQEPLWWQSRATNSFRLNVQPEGVLNAPNLVVEELTWDDSSCDARLTFTARVANIGSLGVREGVSVVFWLGTPEEGGEVLCDALTEQPLPPGSRFDISCTWELPFNAQREDITVVVTIDQPADGSDGAHNE